MGAGTIATKRQRHSVRGFVPIAAAALYYCLAAQLAATSAINDVVKGGRLENPFRDQETFIAVLKCAAIGGSLMVSVVQAAIYRFILAFLSPGTELKFSRHWFFVLISLLPYSAVVTVLFQVDASLLDGLLAQGCFRAVSNVIAAAIYVFCIVRATAMDKKHAIICGVVLSCLNLTVIFATPALAILG